MTKRIPPHRAEKYKRIRRAVRFNSRARQMASCNSLYMGSMAQALLWKALGADWPEVSLTRALHGATDEQLDAGLEQCQNVLSYADKRKASAP